MKLLISLLATAFLVGCGATLPKVEEKMVIKYKYVVITTPDDMLTIPPKTPNIDPQVATDKDAAKWMIQSEQRAVEVQKKLDAIKKQQDRKLKDLETQIPKEDIIIK